MPYKDPVKRKETSKIYLKRYYDKNKERLLKQNKKYRLQNKERLAMNRATRFQNLKEEVLMIYGYGKCACVKCGFNDIQALSIDHINGGGCVHRENINRSDIYTWLRMNDYPKGYQTLCMNCQWIKRTQNKELGYRRAK
jgi:hypothetical protein